jgi:hypothetical protein
VTLRGECGAAVTLVPNLSSFRADIDFPQISISSVGWENSMDKRSWIFFVLLPAPFDSQKYMDSALSFQQNVADAVPCYC